MTIERWRRTLEILLVEDTPGDARLIMEALKRVNVPHRLTTATDGDEAMAVLRKRDAFAQAPRPDMILLDLNLPGMSGREVLAEIRQDSELEGIPVVILTTSSAADDIHSTYGLGATSYIVKPFRLDELVSALEALGDFWQALGNSPPRE